MRDSCYDTRGMGWYKKNEDSDLEMGVLFREDEKVVVMTEERAQGICTKRGKWAVKTWDWENCFAGRGRWWLGKQRNALWRASGGDLKLGAMLWLGGGERVVRWVVPLEPRQYLRRGGRWWLGIGHNFLKSALKALTWEPAQCSGERVGSSSSQCMKNRINDPSINVFSGWQPCNLNVFKNLLH